MISYKLVNILSNLINTTGKNEKLNLLRYHKDDPHWTQLLQLAYDPLTKFYIRKIPEYSELNLLDLDFPEAVKELTRLSSREVTGNQARFVLVELLQNSHPTTVELINCIINRDLGAGVNVALINDVYGKGFIKDAPYQGAVAYKDKLVQELFQTETKKGNCLVSQVKADGRYANIVIANNSVYAEARSGLETVVNGAFDYMKQIENIYGNPHVLNGEITIFGLSRYVSNGIVSSFVSINKLIQEEPESKKVKKDIEKFNKENAEFGITFKNVSEKLSYIVWDIIPLEVYESFGAVQSEPYQNRLEFLQNNLGNFSDRLKVVESKLVSTPEQAMEHFREVASRGEEGTILKSLSSPWIDGKKKHQIKFKLEIELDLIIKGFMYGEEGTKNESVYSRIICSSEDGLLNTVTSGLTESMMRHVTKNHENLVGSVVTIRCSGLSQNHLGEWSVLHPRFDKLRDDKTTANTLQECQDIEKAALGIK